MQVDAILKNNTRYYRALCLSSVLLCLIALLVFGPSGHDDSHITYSAAKFFADGQGVRNINGEAVEQGSSFLHVILLGVLHAVSDVSLATIGPIFSLVLAILCLPATVVLATHMGITRFWLPLLLLSLSTAFSYWSMGGLESTLVSLTILYCVFTFKWFLFDRYTIKTLFHLLLATTLFLLVRPESFFVLVAVLTAIFLFLLNEESSAFALKRLGVMAAVVVALFSLVCLCRYIYFGQIFPQPVYAKSEDFTLSKLGFGLAYFLYAGQLSIICYTLSAFIPLYYWFKQTSLNNLWLLISVSFVLSYLSFIITAGGDWMGGGRFFVPVLPLMVCVFSYYVEQTKRFRLVVGMVVLSSILEIAVFSQLLSTGVPLYQGAAYKKSFTTEPDWQPYSWTETLNYIHTRDLQLINAITPVIQTLTEQQQQPLVIASIQMGMIPYHLRLRFDDAIYFVDMRGLTTKHVSVCADFDEVQKIWTGIFVSYEEYFKAFNKGNCGLPQLDIVYDLLNRTDEDNRKRLETLASQHYRIIYQQQGVIGGLLSQKRLDTPVFIAVREELYQQLPEALRSVNVTLTNKAGK